MNMVYNELLFIEIIDLQLLYSVIAILVNVI